MNNPGYLFRHALLQDAAYDSMLKSKRQKLHGRIARLLEENYPETAETEPELVARHYTAAGNAESAIGYWLAAGRRSLQRGANKEAIGHLGRGLECLTTLPETPERQLQELTLQTALGPALLATKGWGAAEPNAVYQRARELCGRVGDTREMFAALWGIWLFHTARGDVPAARNLIEELLALAEGEQDAELQLQAHHAAWGTICWLGEFGTALEHVEQGLAIYDPEKHRNHALRFGGHDPGVCGKGQGALTLWYLGYPDRASRGADEGLTLAQELSHTPSIAHALLWVCMVHQYRGEADKAAKSAESLIEIATEQGLGLNLVQGMVFRGWTRCVQGDSEAGIAELRETLARFRKAGVGLVVVYNKTLLGRELSLAGHLSEAAVELDDALALVGDMGVHLWEAEIYRLKGELELASATPSHVQAEANFGKSIDVARGQGNKSFELRAAVSLARLWRDQGREDGARDFLQPIYSWFTEGFDTLDLVEAKALLDELS